MASLRERQPFDVVVDTTTGTPESLADSIKRRLAEGPEPTVFRRLRAAPFLSHTEGYGAGMLPV